MRATALVLVGVALFALSNTGRAADDNKDLILGTWQIAYSDAKDIPVGTKLEFTKAGKVNLTIKDKDGKEQTVDAGGYKLEKEYIILTGKEGSKNDKGRICLLNKTSFIVNDEVEDKVMVLKRAKAK